MITGKEKLLEAMIEVYRMEKGAKDFYAKASRKAMEDTAQRVFHQLVQWKDEHMHYIQSLYQAIRDERETVSFEEFKEKTPPEGVGDAIPLRELEEEIGVYSFIDDQGALTLALEIETKSYNLYKKLSETADDINTKAFMKEMMQRQHLHIEYLKGLR